MKRIGKLVVLILSLFAGLLLFNTMRFQSKQDRTITPVPVAAIAPSAIEHFQKLIQFKTISYGDAAQLDSSQFAGLRRFLEKAYPLVHRNLQREVINQYSLLYQWAGTDPSLKPFILIAHMDVVPVEEASRSLWKTDLFAGTVQDGYIWGRGAVDDKINLVSILEAAEGLLAANFRPARTVYFVFGHDEEQYGVNGAQQVAALLAKRNVQAELVVDEGGFITKEKVPGVRKPVALLGTSEKGYLTISLQVEQPGGHSSIPAKETAVDILSGALVKIHEHPFATRLSAPQQDFIEYIGPESPFLQKMAFANSWLFGKYIISQYTKTSIGNALMRTTIAPTMLQAGIKDNIVPSMAKAVINLRLLPGDSSAWVIQKIREAVRDDRVAINILQSNEAAAVTSPESPGFRQVATAVRKVFPEAIISPFLLIGGTDSRYFHQIGNSIIRFSPMTDPEGYHGINERVSIDNYRLVIAYYEQLMKEAR